MRRVRAVIFAPAYPPGWRSGGPARSVHAIAVGAAQHHDVRVVTQDRDLGASERLPVGPGVWHERDGLPVAYTDARKVSASTREMWRLRRPSPDVVYCNGFFNPRFSIFPQLAARLVWGRARLVIAPRGEFGGAAIAMKSSKKRAFVRLYRALRLDRAVLWHASSEREAGDVRAVMGADSQVLIRRNDALLPAEPTPPDPPVQPVEEQRPLKAVFVGRLVPIKGLDTVLTALAGVTGAVELDVYGPEESASYAKACRALAERVRGRCAVTFRGPVEHEAVRSTLAGYDLMVMPTKGENFGQVIAEALSCSLPVMVMDVTPWTETLMAGGGVVVPDDRPSTWAAVLDDYAALGPQARLEARLRAGAAYLAWRQHDPEVDLISQILAEPAAAR